MAGSIAYFTYEVAIVCKHIPDILERIDTTTSNIEPALDEIPAITELIPSVLTEISEIRKTIPPILDEVKQTRKMIPPILKEIEKTRSHIPSVLKESNNYETVVLTDIYNEDDEVGVECRTLTFKSYAKDKLISESERSLCQDDDDIWGFDT